jgi:hypothetical protein
VPRPSLTRIAVALATAAIALATADPASATSPATLTGVDVSYPQCGATLPAGKPFAVVGVNGGLANNYNSCLATEWQYALASSGGTQQARAQAYLNTGDPGNSVADWPSPSQLGAYGSTSVTGLGSCSYATRSKRGANSAACAYIYGYDMVAGMTYSGGKINGDLATFHAATGGQLFSQPTWLDVETANSWQTGTAGQAMNRAVLQGMVAAIRKAAPPTTPAAPVGVYSTTYQYTTITGIPSGAPAGSLAGLPEWGAGAPTQADAIGNCSVKTFTSGQMVLTQWVGGGSDNDVSCIG